MIKIKTVKTIDLEGNLGRKIIFLQGLIKEKLPKNYLELPLSFYFDKKDLTFTSRMIGVIFKKDTFYIEEEFNRRLEFIKKSGQTLHDYKLNLIEKQKKWNGIEIFKI